MADNINASQEKQPVALAKVLYTFTGLTSNELDVQKNDLLEVHNDLTEQWWYVRRCLDGKRGYVPRNYVLLLDSDVIGLKAWFEVDRLEAEYLLLAPSNRPGTYLVRPCSGGYYALSVKKKHSSKENFHFVQHYKITILSDGRCSIVPHITFATVTKLLLHYNNICDGGLGFQLAAPCPRERVPTQLPDAEVNRECITLEEKLGTGSFSEVHLATWNGTTQVAVKTAKPTGLDSNAYFSEAKLLLKLCNPNIIQVLGVCTVGEPKCIILELMPNGSLLTYLRRDNGSLLFFEHLVAIMVQVANAMSYLESCHIVHRDLRAANILVGADNLVKVADFGLARQLDKNGVYICEENGKFPAKWTPVEAATKGHFSVKSDVWSFGVLLWEIITYGGAPYSGMSNREVMEFVSRGYRMPKPNGGHVHCDQNIYYVILECWRFSPEHRPTFSRLREVLLTYASVYSALTTVQSGGTARSSLRD